MPASMHPDPERDEALERLGCAGRALSDAVVLFHARAAEVFGMGSSDWKALGLIAQHGPLSHGALAGRLGLKPASVTNILDRLQAAGWIERRRSAQDRRSIQISANQDRLGEFQSRVFGPLMGKLSDVYARYDSAQLALIADAFERVAAAQATAADELKD